jgi:sensor histidine kinase regulating citrate/malate metabolism
VTEPAASPWYQRISLRTRMLIISSVVVAIVLAIGGVLLLALLRAELVDSADDAGEDTALSIAKLAEEGTLPAELASTEEVAAAVQVVKGGEVISATTKPRSSRSRARWVPPGWPRSSSCSARCCGS